VRDYKDPMAPTLTYTATEWGAFLVGVNHGGFDGLGHRPIWTRPRLRAAGVAGAGWATLRDVRDLCALYEVVSHESRSWEERA
jgi:hypothetical protein